MRTFRIALILAAAAGLAAAQPIIAAGGVLDGASFVKGRPVAPGSLVSIFGTGLASALSQNDTVPLSTSLSGTKVTFNGIQAGLYFVSDGQINAQLPWNQVGNVTLVVTRNNVDSAPMSVPVTTYAPGLFSIPPGAGYAIAINPDGSIAAPVGKIPGFPTRPAKVGDALVILGNGFGPVDFPIANGAASLDHLRNTQATPIVSIGGKAATIGFSGLTPQFPGINQLNVIVPDIPSNDSAPITVQIGGVGSADGVVIAVVK